MGHDIADFKMHNQIATCGDLILRLHHRREFLNYCGQLFGISPQARKERSAEG